MEYEIRFYYPSKKVDEILTMLNERKELMRKARCYEKTVQFDHPYEEMSFYAKEVDGRFRIRVSKSDGGDKCLVSWKKRLPNTREGKVNREEEVELNISPDEIENLKFIVENVLKMKVVESYERYRTRFSNDEVEIAVDEYPFGVAVEIENKSCKRKPVEVVKKWAKKLGLNVKEAYRLSWDDKYAELCREQGVERCKHVEFGLPMPEIEEK